jgi:polyisoprenoid-binding protein YceI
VREFEIVAQESRIGFRYQAAGFGELSARFRTFQGTIRLRDDETDVGERLGPTAEVIVIIATDSVDTGNLLLDRIVMSASLFDTARYPQARFAIRPKRIAPGYLNDSGTQRASGSVEGDSSFTLEGTLRIRDQERDVSLAIAALAISTPAGNSGLGPESRRAAAMQMQRLTAEAHTRISRSAFGVAGFAALVRDLIEIELRIVARRMP